MNCKQKEIASRRCRQKKGSSVYEKIYIFQNERKNIPITIGLKYIFDRIV